MLSEKLEQVLVAGDLGQLPAPQRVQYYKAVCDSLRLNYFTKPFDYIKLNGKVTLYAKKDATDQLRKQWNVSISIVNREKIDDVFVVTAKARLLDREDEAIGAVPIGGMKGANLANAMMKAETKAKRRVTLSICGLGMTDESEIQNIKEATLSKFDHELTDMNTLIGKPPEEPETPSIEKDIQHLETEEENTVDLPTAPEENPFDKIPDDEPEPDWDEPIEVKAEPTEPTDGPINEALKVEASPEQLKSFANSAYALGWKKAQLTEMKKKLFDKEASDPINQAELEKMKMWVQMAKNNENGPEVILGGL